ncbi:hypothetical protein JST97_19575 [bacterium]|nr:hypothetical protein [bacterium]
MDKRTATVYKVVDKQVQVVTVSYGRSDTKNTVINKGLSEGDMVVTLSQGRLKEGQKVDPQSSQAEPGTPSAGSSR